MRHYRKASLPNLTRDVWCDNYELHPLLTTPDATHTHPRTHTHTHVRLFKSHYISRRKFQNSKLILFSDQCWLGEEYPLTTLAYETPPDKRGKSIQKRAFPSLSDANPVRAIMFQAVRITYWCQDCFAPRGHKAEHCTSAISHSKTIYLCLQRGKSTFYTGYVTNTSAVYG